MKKGWAALAVLVLIVPVGILVTWDYEDAWGEWGEVELGENETWVPQQYGGAPLPDYNVEGWDDQFMASLGYWISAIIGISMCVFVTLGIGKAAELWRKGEKGNKENKGKEER